MADEALRKLYPNLKDEELEEADHNLTQYLEIAWEIYEDIRKLNEELLTRPETSLTIKGKVDSPNKLTTTSTEQVISRLHSRLDGETRRT